MNMDVQPKKFLKIFSKCSLALNITSFIVIVVTIVSVLSLVLNLVIISGVNEHRFNRKSTEYLSFLKESLELPLWNYNTVAVTKLGKMMMSNDIVSSLVILDEKENSIFTESKQDEVEFVVRNESVYYQDLPVGSIKLGFTNKLYHQQQRHTMIVGLITISIVILSILSVVTFSVKRFIKRPLKEFSERIDSIARGNYRQDTPITSYVELEGIMKRFNQMAVGIKNREDSLVKTNRALLMEIAERKKAEHKLSESERRYRSLNANIPVGVFRSKPSGEIISANPALLQMLDIAAEIGNAGPMRATDAYLKEADRQRLLAKLNQDRQVRGFECQLKSPDAGTIWAAISARGIEDELGSIKYIDGIVEDITARKLAEAAQRENVEFRKRIFEESMVPLGVMDFETKAFIDCNQAAVSIYGFSSIAETLGKTVLDVTAPTQYDGTSSPEKLEYYTRKAISDGMADFDWCHQRPDGEMWDAEVHLMSFQSNGRQLLQFTLQDITERRRTKKEKEKLQAQLTQAQKMEAIGHLAGGIAHDFNNMLSVVIGNSELAMMDITSNEKIRPQLKAIQDAAQRSSNLVRQLLAFARKQTINPVVLDINDMITGMIKVLRRLIGEDIDLAWIPGHEVGKVKIDPSQIDQILANLLVNARDAIGGVGKVTIETNSVFLDEAYCASHPGLVPGSYIMLAVSDDGCGMDQDTLEQIFEPFFTSKTNGMGTGLGLATVYGIVKQNNGFIYVYSEPGEGSIFKIYLPLVQLPVEQADTKKIAEPSPGGNETVLMVEDDESILVMAQSILTQLGYTVKTARRPDKAIDIAKNYQGEIDLLLTDVVMPLMNGRELAKRIEEMIPGLKCLYMSGYTANGIVHQAVLEDGVCFLPKPFSIRDLARTVREALDG